MARHHSASRSHAWWRAALRRATIPARRQSSPPSKSRQRRHLRLLQSPLGWRSSTLRRGGSCWRQMLRPRCSPMARYSVAPTMAPGFRSPSAYGESARRLPPPRARRASTSCPGNRMSHCPGVARNVALAVTPIRPFRSRRACIALRLALAVAMALAGRAPPLTCQRACQAFNLAPGYGPAMSSWSAFAPPPASRRLPYSGSSHRAPETPATKARSTHP